MTNDLIRASTLWAWVVGVHVATGLASALLVSTRGPGSWFAIGLVGGGILAVARLAGTVGARRVRPAGLAVATLGSSLLSLSLAASTIGILGVDGMSPFSIGWAHPERAAWPQLWLGACLLTVGLRFARKISWARLLQGPRDPATSLSRGRRLHPVDLDDH